MVVMADITYQRVVNKGHLPYMYLKVKLEMESEVQITVVYFKAGIVDVLKTLFGEIGSVFVFDILQYLEEKQEAVIRVRSCDFVKLRCALTSCRLFARIPCAIRVVQVSSHLIGLAVNSRTLTIT